MKVSIRIISSLRRRTMKRLTAKDIMNKDVKTVQDDMTVHDLAEFLSENIISGAPVLNRIGKVVGVVSLSDIVRSNACRAGIVKSKMKSDYYFRGWEERLNEDEMKSFHVEVDDGLIVHEIMTPLIYKVEEDASIGEMADTMIGGNIHRLIVTREDRVVGIVTTLDMLKAIRDHAD
jgi:CBS domain-containing protein